jgi:hypothetical protein
MVAVERFAVPLIQNKKIHTMFVILEMLQAMTGKRE